MRDHSPVLLVVSAVCTAASVAAAFGAATTGELSLIVTSVVLLATAALTATNGWIEVIACERELAVRSVLLGIRWKTIRWSDVERARTTTTSPLVWGGWGYRFAGGRSGVILGAGEAFECLLRDGKLFVLTTREAPTLLALATLGGVDTAASHTDHRGLREGYISGEHGGRSRVDWPS